MLMSVIKTKAHSIKEEPRWKFNLFWIKSQPPLAGQAVLSVWYWMVLEQEVPTAWILILILGSIMRAVSCLNQVLFAINEEYCLNGKKAVKMIASFAQAPANYKERVDEIFGLLSANPSATIKACSKLRQLVEEVKVITERSL